MMGWGWVCIKQIQGKGHGGVALGREQPVGKGEKHWLEF